MPRKPLFISIMAFMFMSLAISFPVQVAYMFHYGPLDIAPIFTKLTPLNYVLMGLFMVTAYLTYTTNKLIFLLLPFMNFFVFLNNFVVAEYGQIYSHAQTLVASTLFLLLTLSFYQKDIYQIYNDIRFRWWLTSPRYQKIVPITLKYNDQVIETKTFDISQTGMFIECDDRYQMFKIPNMQDIEIILHNGHKIIPLKAKIVRKSIAKGHYPAGLGVQINYDNSQNTQEIYKELFEYQSAA